MTAGWSNTRALIIGLALIVLTNTIALSGVAYNRSGEPSATLQLTERELQIPYWRWPDNENSGIDLRLAWRVHDTYDGDESASYSWDRSGAWLNREKLDSLGFETSTAIRNEERDAGGFYEPSRDVFLVLEYDGDAHRAALEHARKMALRTTTDTGATPESVRGAKARLEDEERSESRLFVIDAGVDAEALRTRYARRDKYAIVRGRIDLVFGGVDASSPIGRISMLFALIVVTFVIATKVTKKASQKNPSPRKAHAGPVF